MKEKEVTNREKVEKLKQNSSYAIEERRKQILNSTDMYLNNQKRKTIKKEKSSFGEKMQSFSVSFTEKDLLLQVCIVIPIVLLLLIICNQVLLHG